MTGTAKTPVIKVLCADDNRFVLDAVASRLGLEADVSCVGTIATADELSEAVGRTKADVVLLDIEMPGRDPFEALKAAAGEHPGMRAVVLSAHVRESYLSAAVDAGAWGYLSKSDPPEEIVRAIRRAVEGEFTLGPSVAEHCRRSGGETG